MGSWLKKKSTKTSPSFSLSSIGEGSPNLDNSLRHQSLWEHHPVPSFTDREAEHQRREWPTRSHRKDRHRAVLRSRPPGFRLPLMPPLLSEADSEHLLAEARRRRMGLRPGLSVLPLQGRRRSVGGKGTAAFPREPWTLTGFISSAWQYLLWLSLASCRDISGQTQTQQPSLFHQPSGEQYWINRDLLKRKGRKMDWQRWFCGEKENWCL